VKFVYEWQRVFLFSSKISIHGNLIKRWQFANMRLVLFPEGADAIAMRDYATNKELFVYKLKDTQ